MSFHEIRFPVAQGFGSLGGPERRTDIVSLANGFEERNTPWSHSRRRYDAGLGLRSLEDVEEMIAFFEARRGQIHGFRWKDWTDFKSCGIGAEVSALDQVIGTGDGVAVAFYLSKTYHSGEMAYERPIRKPVEGSVRVAADGGEISSGFQVDTARGVVTFDTAPEAGIEITAGFEFDVPVRFDTDWIPVSVASFQAGEIPNVPLVEIRV